jgi:RNA polymerase sigma-70 factor (ECF subfamily)
VIDREADEQTRIRAVLDREPGAFEALVREYQRLCWHIVYRMVHDADDARDLCQETFLRVHRRLHTFRFECPLKAWIGRIAYSIALRHLERRRAARVVPLDEDDERIVESIADETLEFDRVADAQIAAQLRAAVDALPAVPRTLVTLYHLEELGIGEIAEITGMSEGTIKSHLSRARARMAEWLVRRGVSGA